jgi:hypothetical protein
MTWQALSSIGSSMGAPQVNYDGFAAAWDSEDETGILHQLVDRFDANGLVIKTNNKDNMPQQGQQQAGELEKMAKRATKLGK